jgi:hypothetical protein
MRSITAGRGQFERRYYIGVSVVFLLLVFWTFARTFYLQPFSGAPALSLLLHIHGAVMTGWVVLLVVQSTLIAAPCPVAPPARLGWRRLGRPGGHSRNRDDSERRCARSATSYGVRLEPDSDHKLGSDSDGVLRHAGVETPLGSVRARVRLNESLAPNVACGQHGWWQDCAEIGADAYDPFSADGANFNLIIGDDAIDLVSGSVPHRAYLCEVRRA